MYMCVHPVAVAAQVGSPIGTGRRPFPQGLVFFLALELGIGLKNPSKAQVPTNDSLEHLIPYVTWCYNWTGLGWNFGWGANNDESRIKPNKWMSV